MPPEAASPCAADGYYFILGRSDDVINVAGHRLGSREIEEAITADPRVASAVVVGIHDDTKGQAVIAMVVLRQPADADPPKKEQLKREISDTVARQLGLIARPAQVQFVKSLPQTRSGKSLRRAIQAILEGRDPGDLTTLEDPAPLDEIQRLGAEHP